MTGSPEASIPLLDVSALGENGVTGRQASVTRAVVGGQSSELRIPMKVSVAARPSANTMATVVIG